MARAWFAGIKTQTRREIKPQPPDGYGYPGIISNAPAGTWGFAPIKAEGKPLHRVKCRYGAVGDHVWIGEALIPIDGIVHYEADRSPVQGGIHRWEWKPKSMAAMYMPHWACRSTAEIVGVKIEPVQAITPQDAEAEGIPPVNSIIGVNCDGGRHGEEWGIRYFGVHDDVAHECPTDAYREIWEHINGKKSWDKDPWVFALTLRRLT